jgi:hypothetical protein
MIDNHPFVHSLPLVAIAVALSLTPVAAGQRGGAQGGPRYDTGTEATVTGTVAATEQIAESGRGRGRRGLGGTHLSLKTSTGTLNVHLGPTAYLTAQKISVATGDRLEIVGSRVTVDNESVIVAKSVKKGDQTWTLRDAAGLPLWRGGRI